MLAVLGTVVAFGQSSGQLDARVTFGFFGFSVRPSTGSEIAFGQATRPELWKMEKLTSALK